MQLKTTSLMHIKKQIWASVAALLISLSMLIIVYLAGRKFQIELSDLTRDPSAVLKGPAYVGFLSNLGIFFWSASAAICFFTSWLMGQRGNQGGFAGMLFWSGLLLLTLGFDDAFQLHEKLFSNIRYVPEELFFATYLVCTVMITLVYRRSFFQTDFLIWMMALAAFGMSILIDKAVWYFEKDRAFYEDSFKFIGIIAWAFYYIRTTARLLQLEEKQT